MPVVRGVDFGWGRSRPGSGMGGGALGLGESALGAWKSGGTARGGRHDVDGAPLGSARLELEEGEEERQKGNVASGRG